MRRHIYIILLFSFFFSIDAWQANAALPVPRFVSLKSNEVNVRTGPGPRYIVKWVLVKKDMPVEIITEFEQWRKIRDFSGDEGWVHKNMLSGKRQALINYAVPEKESAGTERVEELLALYKQPDQTTRITMFAENAVVGQLMTCKGEWCRLKINGKKGWTLKKNIWGVYPDENFD